MKIKTNEKMLYDEITSNKTLTIIAIFITVVIFTIAYTNILKGSDYFKFINEIFISVPYCSLITIISGLFINLLIFRSFLGNNLLEQRFKLKKDLFNYILKYYTKILFIVLGFIIFTIIIFSNFFSHFNLVFMIGGTINENIVFIFINLYLTLINITIWFLISYIILKLTNDKLGIIIVVFIALYQYVSPTLFNINIMFPYVNTYNNLWLLLLTPVIVFILYKLSIIIYTKQNWKIR